MNAVSIPKPCHENWAAMTPTEQGAFCQKCSTNVIDFSVKSNDEILNFLKENEGKHVCGRFKTDQLDEFNNSYLEWENQDARTFQSKFLYACLLVFGMALFNGYSQQEEMMLGQVVVTKTTTQPAGVSNAAQNVEQPAASIYNERPNEGNYKKGKIKYDPKTTETNCSPNELFIKGEIAYTPPVRDTLINKIQKDTAGPSVLPVEHSDTDNLQTEEQPPETYADTLSLLAKNAENLAVSQEVILAYKPRFSALLYPNPSASNTVLLLDIAENGTYVVSLYNAEGQEVMNVYNGTLAVGRTNLLIDCNELESGNYYVRITGGKQIEIYQLVISK